MKATNLPVAFPGRVPDQERSHMNSFISLPCFIFVVLVVATTPVRGTKPLLQVQQEHTQPTVNACPPEYRNSLLRLLTRKVPGHSGVGNRPGVG